MEQIRLTTCKHGNCTVQIAGGEGVSVSGAGYRVKFCCWDHAARWVLAMAHRTAMPDVRDGRWLRALAELDGIKGEVKQ